MMGFTAGMAWFQGKAYRWAILILAIFVLLSLLFTYPLGFTPADRVAYPAGDPLINVWIMAWDAHALLTEPWNLFQANIFYPYPYSLAYNEHLLASAVLGLPLQLIFNNPVAVLGVLQWLTFVLSGFGGYLLGRRVSGSRWGGLIAGFIFAFCPYKMSQIHHFQNLSAQWMPFVFLMLDRAIARGRPRDLFLLGLFTLLQVLSCAYYAVFLIVGIVVVAIPWLLVRYWRRWRSMASRLGALVLTGLVTAGCALPFFLPYVQVAELMDTGRSLSYVIQLSPDLLNYLAAPPHNRLYGALTAALRKEPEGSLLPGVMAVALALVGLVAGWRGRDPIQKALIGSFALVTLLAGLFSLGPTIHVAGNALLRGPYIVLYRYMPGFSSIRVPGRFAVLVMLGVAVLAGVGASRLLAGRRPAARHAVALALLGLTAIEYASIPLPTEPVQAAGPAPTLYEWLAAQPSDFAIVELPIDQYPSFTYDIPYMVGSTHHWKRLVNGHTTYFPAGHVALAEMLQSFPDEATIQTLRMLGVRYVIVHRDLLPEEKAEIFDAGFVRKWAGLAWVGTFGDAWVYELQPASDDKDGLQLGTPAARPFLLKGWSRHDERMAGRPFVWSEGDASALLVPAWGGDHSVLRIEARAFGGPARCHITWDGVELNEPVLFAEIPTTHRIALPAPASPGLHLLRWQCDPARLPVKPLNIGTTNVSAPTDLAVAAAGVAAGDYVDLYVAGKRYAVERDCRTCVGLIALRAGRPDDLLWETCDLSRPEEIERALKVLTDLPADAVLMLGARGGAVQPAALRAALAAYGADSQRPMPDGEAYVLIGVRGAPAGTAIEVTCQEGCWEYVGQPWPKRRLAVERVEMGP